MVLLVPNCPVTLEALLVLLVLLVLGCLVGLLVLGRPELLEALPDPLHQLHRVHLGFV